MPTKCYQIYSSQEQTELPQRNQFRQQKIQSIREDFGNYFETHITKANEPEFPPASHTLHLWVENNTRASETTSLLATFKIVLNGMDQIIPND